MTKDELLEIIREELASVLQEMHNLEESMCPVCKSTPCECGMEMDERTIASHEPPRKMSKDQVKKRDGIGKKLLKNKRSIRYFKDKFGDDWKSYLWAASTNRSLAGKGKGKKK
jgi:hypothetical protein